MDRFARKARVTLVTLLGLAFFGAVTPAHATNTNVYLYPVTVITYNVKCVGGTLLLEKTPDNLSAKGKCSTNAYSGNPIADPVSGFILYRGDIGHVWPQGSRRICTTGGIERTSASAGRIRVC